MHASLEQLIGLRDDEPTLPEVCDHVRGCETCTHTLDELTGVATGIRSIPDPALPPNVWPQVLDRVERVAAPVRPRRRWMLATGFGLAASVAAALALVALPSHAPFSGERPSATESALKSQTLDRLMAQSRYLEWTVVVLGNNAEQTPVSGSTATTIAALEDRIALVDYAINHAAPAPRSNRVLKELWQQRVQLLQALAAVRYAQVADNRI